MRWALDAVDRALKTKMPGLFTQALRKLETNSSHRISGISARTFVTPQNTEPPIMARHVRLVVERLFVDLYMI